MPLSKHDEVVYAIKREYESHGLQVSVNAGTQQTKEVSGYFPDVYAAQDIHQAPFWLIEVETADSITDSEAQNQWVDYDRAYHPAWWLAVPSACKEDTEELLDKHGIFNCTVVAWEMGEDGAYTFCTLPGLDWRNLLAC
ncbi:MAG: hypothetical protein OXS35_10235 [Dehalococcoidia bacterium]|nr:hypothetical protein [Dehalococcoidia bacterium]